MEPLFVIIYFASVVMLSIDAFFEIQYNFQV